MAEKGSDDKEIEKPIVAKTAVDLQRLKVLKLMKNPDKPVLLPERPKSKNTPSVPEFVRNVMGSSAGAGSGEFHVYRHLRRKEYSRQKFIQEKCKKDVLDDEYHKKLEENKIAADEATARKRAKRLKKKQKQKGKKKSKTLQPKTEPKSEQSDSSSEESESEEKTGVNKSLDDEKVSDQIISTSTTDAHSESNVVGPDTKEAIIIECRNREPEESERTLDKLVGHVVGPDKNESEKNECKNREPEESERETDKLVGPVVGPDKNESEKSECKNREPEESERETDKLVGHVVESEKNESNKQECKNSEPEESERETDKLVGHVVGPDKNESNECECKNSEPEESKCVADKHIKSGSNDRSEDTITETEPSKMPDNKIADT